MAVFLFKSEALPLSGHVKNSGEPGSVKIPRWCDFPIEFHIVRGSLALLLNEQVRSRGTGQFCHIRDPTGVAR